MIELSCSDMGLPGQLMETPGAFLWWYVDLVDRSGNGLVVIWSFGLPFLPGHADGARRGDLQPPSNRPSLNVSLYRRGKLDFYLLQEFDPADVQWQRERDGESSCWVFGDSNLCSERVEEERRVELSLVLDVPAMEQAVYVDVSARGPELRGDWAPESESTPERALSQLPDHQWSPLLCAASGRVDVDMGEGGQQFVGRIYHDRNGGCLPLHDLGIQWWSWGRVALEECEFVYFVLHGRSRRCRALFLMVESDGTARKMMTCRVGKSEESKNLAGLRFWRRVQIERRQKTWLNLHFEAVDSGPFYQRSLVRGTVVGGGQIRGIAEFCEPDRVDLGRHRPMVKMRVHHRRGDNSMWLPLFSGPRKGRVRRLLRMWAKGG